MVVEIRALGWVSFAQRETECVVREQGTALYIVISVELKTESKQS